MTRSSQNPNRNARQSGNNARKQSRIRLGVVDSVPDDNNHTINVRLETGAITLAEIPVTANGDYSLPTTDALVYVLERQGALPTVIGVPYEAEDAIPNANPGERVLGHDLTSSNILYDAEGDIHINAASDVLLNGTKSSTLSLPSLSDLPNGAWAWDATIDNIQTGANAIPTDGRLRHVAVVDGGIAYVVGGYDSNNNVTDTLFAYDIDNDSWSQKAALPTAVGSATAGIVNGTLYAVGGYNGTSYINTVQAYDIANDTWTTVANYPITISNAGAVVYNGLLYVTGGYDGSSATSAVYVYDPSANSWTSQTAMPAARYDIPSSLPLANGVAYVAGGANSSNAQTSSMYAYDIASDTWATKSSMPITSDETAAAAIGSLVYIHDGASSPGFIEYDPASDSYTSLTAQPNGKGMASAISNSGLFYVFGGNVSNRTDAYKP